jgi:UDP-N-acetylmuramyl pentapeptide phosphotransferase/UDP-N-acetylglucosamine-1-phosphate transferase
MGAVTTYLVILVLLLAAELFYFRIADRFNIIDKPNERSSHNYITIRGGGIIWWVAALLFLLFHFSSSSLWFFAGITLIAGVSFMDDVRGLGQKVRLLFHLLAMSCAFYVAGVFGSYPFHFYQILANEKGMPHRLVSLIYFAAQLICSALIILLYPVMGWWIFVILLLILMGLYMIKFPMMKAKKENFHTG